MMPAMGVEFRGCWAERTGDSSAEPAREDPLAEESWRINGRYSAREAAWAEPPREPITDDFQSEHDSAVLPDQGKARRELARELRGRPRSAEHIKLGRLAPGGEASHLGRVEAGRDVKIIAKEGGFAVGVAIQQPPDPPSKPVRLAPRPTHLAGREDLLAYLRVRLTAGMSHGRPRVVALYGLGGMGKTSMAVEYAYRQLGEVGAVWQFAAENPAATTAGFADLAAQLGIRDRRDPVAAVHAVLAVRPGGWLLVFDNAPDAAALAAVRPPDGDGQVIITSQNPNWPAGQAFEVPVLGTEAAAEFLMDRTEDADQDAAWELAEELGCLPLALEQAAAYMRVTGRGITAYLGLYRERRAEMHARGDPAGYDKRVATTWSLAFDQIGRSAPQATGLLRFLACCAPDDIPLRLLLQLRPGFPCILPAETALVLAPLLADPLAVDDAIMALRRFCLISAPASGDGSVSVHRLVQAVTLDQVQPWCAAAWQRTAARIIDAALPSDPRDPATWAAYAALFPHAQAALPGGSAASERIAAYVGYSGRRATARDLMQTVADARETELGSEHPDTLTARGHLAYWTGRAGDPASARDQFTNLLPQLSKILGTDHTDTLAARANLAHWAQPPPETS